MTKRILLFALVLMAATNEACAAYGTAWSLGSKKSKIAPQPTPLAEATMKESESAKTASIRSGSSVSPESVKKSPSLDSTDSETSSESDAEKRIRINEIIRYFEGIADKIFESHYIPKVKKSTSMPWTRSRQEERIMTEQYNQCSRGYVRNRLMTCTNHCIENGHELLSGQGKEEELHNECIRICTNSGKLFLAEKAEQIESYNDKQQRR